MTVAVGRSFLGQTGKDFTQDISKCLGKVVEKDVRLGIVFSEGAGVIHQINDRLTDLKFWKTSYYHQQMPI